MGIELDLKHVSPWALAVLLDAPAAAETFFLYRLTFTDEVVSHLKRR